MLDEGRLSAEELISFLEAIASRNLSARVLFQGPDGRVSIGFSKGVVVDVASTSQPFDRELGKLLAARGLVSPSEFQDVLREQQVLGGSLVDRLIRERLASQQDLDAAIRNYHYSALLELLRWEESDLQLDLEADVTRSGGGEPLTVEEVLVRAAADLGEDSPVEGPMPDLELRCRVEEEVPATRVLGVDDDTDVEDEADILWLTRVEAQLLEGLTADTTVGVFAAEQGLNEYQAQYAVHRLIRMGLVQQFSPAASADRDVLGSSIDLAYDESDLDGGLDFDDLATVADSEPEQDDFEALGEEPAPPPSESFALTQAIPHMGPSVIAGLLCLGFLFNLARGADRESLRLPLPWLGEERLDLQRSQRSTVFRRIDGAVRSYYLVFGRFPESLGLLTDIELLAPEDQFDPVGQRIRYTTLDPDYLLQPLRDGEPVPGQEFAESRLGDFWLNPQFLEPKPSTNAIVLLD